MLATLIEGRTDDGEAFRDNEIRNQIVSLIAAGYETTSAALGWGVYAHAERSGSVGGCRP